MRYLPIMEACGNVSCAAQPSPGRGSAGRTTVLPLRLSNQPSIQAQGMFLSAGLARSGLVLHHDTLCVRYSITPVCHDFRADVARGKPSLSEPTTIGPDRARWDRTTGGREILDHAVGNRAASARPLTTSVSQTRAGEAEAFLRIPPMMGDLDEPAVDFDTRTRIRDG